MFDVTRIAGGLAIAGALGLAGLGAGTAVADAATPPTPQVSSVQDAAQNGGPVPGASTPSPYAIYGSSGLCGTPGLYFVNICE
ncbi:hypothetical protein MMAD_10060 [Mycolicibacterium madagascariense]|uniref:Uncharacterized protein n=1 Tax=Mycolicibacterium madagascariense TaxID=212765 RepID=A0A7I7XDH2_9MYCO|nr:hypothetical protein [Mycolicibacterium madagascariense]MCV7011331.1 hypothetical protein [Mycolicibacterium madagascariense]BBZ26711.1 hypothetical protein MMAD_10060 [Mycolicibacterium madagascariense]